MRNYNIDKLKLYSSIMVVLVHTTAFMAVLDNNFWNYRIYRYALDFAVVYFFAVSGYYLSEKKSLKYTKRQIINTLKLYVYSSICYIIFRSLIVTISYFVNDTSLFEGIAAIASGVNYTFILDGIFGSYHLWYLGALLIGLLIFNYFIYKKASGLVIIAISFILYSLKIIGFIPDIGIFYNNGFLNAIMSMSLGYIVSDYSIRLKKPLSISFISLFLYSLFSWVGVIHAKEIFLWLSVFSMISYVSNNPGKESRISFFTKYSTSIYIMHIFILDLMILLFNFLSFEKLDNKLVYIIITTVIAIIFSPIINKFCNLIYSKVTSFFF